MPFWNHMNSIAYNPELDQIVLSFRGSSELWVIDHGTTTAQAAGHTGGTRGKGGDLLYRWGNPVNYGRGAAANQMLFDQHDAQWIDPDRPGAGNLLIFNNGIGYFRRAAVNAAVDLLRRRAVRADSAYDEQAPHAAVEPPSLLKEQLRRAIATLDSDDAALFLLRHVEGLSIEELAGVFQLKKNNVAVRLHRVRHRLQAEMER